MSEPMSNELTVERRLKLRHSFTLALASGLLGLMVVMASSGRTEVEQLAEANSTDLVVLLDSLSQRLTRLQEEQIDLASARNEILSGSDEEALAQTRQQLFAMQVLAGTVPVQGEGVELKLFDTSSGLNYDTVLSLIEELRDAGAEAIEINGFRVGARSSVSQNSKGKVLLDGKVLKFPLTVLAIGSTDTLSVALQIPGGVADTVAADGGRLRITPGPVVILSTVHFD